MSRKDAFLEHLRDIKRAVDALMEEVETGGLPYGEYSGEGPVDEPPTEEPPTEEPPVEEPPAEPDPTPDPDPAPPPATPNPPATNDDLVDGLRTGATPCGSQGAPDVAQCTDPGVIVSDDIVRITQTLPVFEWDIGSRRMEMTARVGRLSINSINGRAIVVNSKGKTVKLPLIWLQPGGGFDRLEWSTFHGMRGAMVLKQEPGAFAGEITRCDLRGMEQDAFKVGGSCVIHENLIADAVYRGGSPHSDVLTVMSAEGDVVFRNNYVDWVYLDQNGAVMPDQSGINNWFRIEAYPAYSGRYDDVIIEGNALRHANGTSFAMQVTGKNNPVWDGSIKVRDNRMEKAGGNRKILYAASARISEWTGNTDFAGNDIPYSAT